MQLSSFFIFLIVRTEKVIVHEPKRW